MKLSYICAFIYPVHNFHSQHKKTNSLFHPSPLSGRNWSAAVLVVATEFSPATRQIRPNGSFDRIPRPNVIISPSRRPPRLPFLFIQFAEFINLWRTSLHNNVHYEVLVSVSPRWSCLLNKRRPPSNLDCVGMEKELFGRDRGSFACLLEEKEFLANYFHAKNYVALGGVLQFFSILCTYMDSAPSPSSSSSPPVKIICR